MTTELQNKVWSILPKEFKEEVKKDYYDCKHCNADACAIELETVFGKHNLTSDAEGEEDEILTVSRKDMQFYYQYYKAKRESELNAERKAYYKGRSKVLLDLFGSKCLPNEEPTPAEPKFKIGEFAMFNGRKVEIIGYSDHRPQIYRIHVFTENYQTKVHEFDLEPCTEPKNEHNTDNAVQKSANVNSNHSQDHIGNANEMVSKSPNRLHIAAMAMQGMLANEGISCFTDVQELEHMDFITYHALEYADKLIKKANQDEQD